MLRAIREVSPSWIVGENVRGLTNWNGGLVFDEVQADLEAIGYEVIPFLLPACAVNAPHRRDRIWFIAYSISTGERTDQFQSLRSENAEISGQRTQTIYDAFGSNGSERITTESDSRRSNWQTFPTVSPICNGDDGLSDRLDSITFPKWRNESIKAGGNAVVPQLVFNIFKAIQSFNNQNQKP